MANVLFCSDLHLGHELIPKFRGCSSVEENTARIKDDWHKKVTKRDKVFVLGDVAFKLDALHEFGTWVGDKVLIKGNHDCFYINEYLKVFKSVEGFYSYKKAWLSHCPVHPSHLRGRLNIHGHTHSSNVLKRYSVDEDDNYFNVSVENLIKTVGSSIISLHEIRDLRPRFETPKPAPIRED